MAKYGIKLKLGQKYNGVIMPLNNKRFISVEEYQEEKALYPDIEIISEGEESKRFLSMDEYLERVKEKRHALKTAEDFKKRTYEDLGIPEQIEPKPITLPPESVPETQLGLKPFVAEPSTTAVQLPPEKPAELDIAGIIEPKTEVSIPQLEMEIAPAVSTKAVQPREQIVPGVKDVGEIRQEPMGITQAVGRGLVSGSIDVAGTVGTVTQYMGGKTGIDFLEREGKKTHEYWEKQGEKYVPPEKLQGSIIDNPELLAKGTWWAYNTARMVPSLAAMIIPGVGTAKYINILGKTMKWSAPTLMRLARLAPSIIGGTAGGTLEGANTYQEILKRGGTKEEAEAGMEMMTLAAGSLNAISFGYMTKKMPPGLAKGIIGYIERGATEGITEYLEEPAEALIKMKLGHATKEELFEQMKQGVNVFPPAFLMGVGGAAVTRKALYEKPPEAKELKVPAEPITKETIEKMGFPPTEIETVKPEVEKVKPEITTKKIMLKSPDEFDEMGMGKSTLITRSKEQGIEEKGLSFIVGKIAGKEQIQALRFDRKIWNDESARLWLEKNKDKFIEKPAPGVKITPKEAVTLPEPTPTVPEVEKVAPEAPIEAEKAKKPGVKPEIGEDTIAILTSRGNLNATKFKLDKSGVKYSVITKPSEAVKGAAVYEIIGKDEENIRKGIEAIGGIVPEYMKEKPSEVKPKVTEKRALIDTIKRRGRKFEVIKKADGTLVLESLSKIKGKPTTVLPYSAEEFATYRKRQLGGEKALKIRFKDKTLLRPNEISEPMALLGRYGNYRGELDIFKNIMVGNSFIGAKPLVKDTKIDKSDMAVKSYNEYARDPEQGLTPIDSYDELVEIARQTLYAEPEEKRLERELNNGYTIEEIEEMERQDPDWDEIKQEEKVERRDDAKIDKISHETVTAKISDIMSETEVSDSDFQKALKEWEEIVAGKPLEVKPTKEIPLKKIKADYTTAMFDTKDARTGKPIKKGEPVYRLEETGEMIKVSTYKNMIKRPEQEALFAEEIEKDAKKEIIEKPSEVKDIYIPKNIEKSIKKIATIDKKQKALAFEANAIIESSAVGQPPPVLGRTLDKINNLQKQKAKIWNDEIRNKIIPGTNNTFWQMAVKSNLVVNTFGKEEYLKFYAEDIRKLAQPEITEEIVPEKVKRVAFEDVPYSVKEEPQLTMISELEGKMDLFKKQKKEPPSGISDLGGYAIIPKLPADEYPASPMDLPEIVELAHQLMGGKYPHILKKMRGMAIGRFRPKTGQIDILAETFKDINEATNTVAHEIGHLIDWLPGHELKRGNILGHIASLKNYLKKYMAGKPGGEPPLTGADKRRLRKIAEQMVRKTVEMEIDEEIRREIPITPDDVLNIWKSTVAHITDAKLYDYVQRLSRAEKKSIVKEAFKGSVREDLKKFARIIKEKTGRKIKKRKFTINEQEIVDKHNELIREEIEKRMLLGRDQIIEELKSFTMEWKPFNPNQSFRYTRYRYKPVELYGDALSALITNPQFLKEKAPHFYEGFFNYIDSKPEVRDAYNKIQNDIKSGEINTDLVKRIRNGFNQKEKEYAKSLELQREKLFSADAWGTTFIDRHFSIIRHVKQIGESNIPPELNPRYKIEDMVYSGSEADGYYIEFSNKVLKPLKKANLTLDDLGEYLLHWRISTERAKLANPYGLTLERSKARIKEMDDDFGPVLKETKDAFRKLREEWLIGKMKEANMYSPELMKIIEDTKNYVTFDIVGHLEKNYGRLATSHIYHQIGTFSPAGNPVVATVLKDLLIMRSINRKIAAKSVVDFFEKHFPDEIKDADTKWNGKFHALIDSRDPRFKLVVYLEKGELKGKYLTKYVAESFQKNPAESMLISRVLQTLSNPQRELFTGKNFGFWLFNVLRDYRSATKQLPGLKLTNFLPKYLKAVGPAFKSSFGFETPITTEMFKGKMLISVVDYRGDLFEDTAFERLMKHYHLNEKSWNNKIIKPIKLFWEYWGDVGQSIERIPKIAGYRYLKERFPEMPPEVIAHIVRKRAGSPDFLRKGTGAPIYNNLFLYSNAMVQGYRSAFETAKDMPGEYAWKTVKYNLMPKLVMMAAAMGLLGATFKGLIDRVSSYNKSNYTIIPLGITPNGKTVYIRIPEDEMGRFFGGVFWKLFSGEKKKLWANLFDYMAGQAPTINPIFSVLFATVEYMSGNNPYDHFRGRNVIADRVFSAGKIRSHKEFAKWIANQLGSGIVYRFKSGNTNKIKTELEKVIGYPIADNTIGRFIRISDYGLREDINEDLKQLRAIGDEKSLLIREGIDKILAGKILKNNEIEAIAEKFENIDKRFIKSMAFQYGNVYVEKLLTAQSKEERVIILNRMLKDPLIILDISKTPEFEDMKKTKPLPGPRILTPVPESRKGIEPIGERHSIRELIAQ